MLSLLDYMMDLRRYISNEMQVASPERFFDSVAFWQNAYQQSEAEQVRLQNTIFELEQRVQSFHSKVKDNQMSDGSPLAKRKLLLAANENGRGTPAKKAQASTAGTKIPDHQKDNGKSESDYENGLSVCFYVCLSDASTNSKTESSSQLLRQIHTVQIALKKKKAPKTLIKDAVILCKVAETEIIGAIIHSTQPASQLQTYLNQQINGQSIPSIIKAVELAFNLTLQCLHKIIGTPDEQQGKGQIIFYLVVLFQATMTALAKNCTAASEQANAKKNVPQDTSASKVPQRGHLGKFAKAKEPLASKKSNANIINEVAQQLTNALCAMTRSLDLNRSPDQEIMEGILFLAIERVGRILALLTFKDRKKPSGNHPDLNPPKGLTAMKEESMTPQMVQLEAKYLVIFLEQAIGHDFTVTHSLQPAFLRNSRLRFKRTLLQAVFGDDDPRFEQGLTRPPTPPALSFKMGGDPQAFSEWFTGELWRLIGWDILASTAQS